LVLIPSRKIGWLNFVQSTGANLLQGIDHASEMKFVSADLLDEGEKRFGSSEIISSIPSG